MLSMKVVSWALATATLVSYLVCVPIYNFFNKRWGSSRLQGDGN